MRKLLDSMDGPPFCLYSTSHVLAEHQNIASGPARSFLDLSPEIRAISYDFLFAPAPGYDYGQLNYNRDHAISPIREVARRFKRHVYVESCLSMMLSCRAVFAEVREFVYGYCVFRLDDDCEQHSIDDLADIQHETFLVGPSRQSLQFVRAVCISHLDSKALLKSRILGIIVWAALHEIQFDLVDHASLNRAKKRAIRLLHNVPRLSHAFFGQVVGCGDYYEILLRDSGDELAGSERFAGYELFAENHKENSYEIPKWLFGDDWGSQIVYLLDRS